ncbi:SLAIN motif-containing protein-like isoform X2 [Pezoporus flaviventris]|uniref:SLAIN motif-containing protein-like isoform X2 n=1 Tax=Pezoporus flaviventris TaxID=889875 RepID=UPI002AB2C887|nr:SLAIN motif-containing protein-like isoform X2 [Pezoporus flaviventris]
MMVVPGNVPVIQQDHAFEPALGRDSMENSAMGPATAPAPQEVGAELAEVRKLRELVRRLEIENQHPRTKSSRSVLGTVQSELHTVVDNHGSGLNGMEINNSINAITEKQELQIMVDLHSQLSKIRKEAGDNNCFTKDTDAQMQYSSSSATEELSSSVCKVEVKDDGDVRCSSRTATSDSTELMGNVVLAGIDSSVKTNEQNPSQKCRESESLSNDTDLDEVKVLELENCNEEEDCWLYVSPRKSVDQKTASPLKWCRQVLDNPSPETEVACRTLLSRLDQGYLSMHSALSSQSSVDSELSTSDDSISMGYKLQDLTDVQVMARLQEESLRQDCASSSASVSRRSSSASLHSLRRGTYSDQEFDTYSLEDEDDYDCSLSYRSAHRYSPSPLSSPRCQSPSSSADYSRSSTSRIRPPRRSVQSPMQDRLKYANSEEEMRHSMPNLARTSLRSLESVRSSRSLESDLQVPSSRIPRTQQRSAGLAPSKLRYSSSAGQSPLTVRQPMKAGSCTNSLLTPRQPVKACSYTGPVSGVRKPQASSQLHAGSSSSTCTTRSSNMVTVAKNSPIKARTSVGGISVPKNKPTPPSRRFLQSAQTTEDDSWKDGCY